MLKKLAKVSSKGHIILPKRVRDELKITTGDYVEIQLIDDSSQADKAVKIVPAKSKAENLAGILKDKVKGKMNFKATRDEVTEEIAKDVAKKLNRR